MIANKIRQKILLFNQQSNEGHIPSSFSIVEILVALFLNEKMTSQNDWLKRLVLSKGHASFAYYAILAEMGLLSADEQKTVGLPGSKLYGHLPYVGDDNRFSFGSGSLGHGLPYAVGKCFTNDSGLKYYCIIGDGEANEGTFWESLLLLEKFPCNLTILVDNNSSSERAIKINDKFDKLGIIFPYLIVKTVNGHDINQIVEALNIEGPVLLNCKTIKGYPISDMMNNPIWHHRTPSKIEYAHFMSFLR